MTAALLAFLASVLAGAGARDQVLIARLSAGRSLPLTVLVAAVVTSMGTAVLVAEAAGVLSAVMTADARVLFAGVAAVVAGLECLVVGPGKAPAEPTRSFFAHTLVIFAHQLTDGARFLVFAIAVATAVPAAAALGGAAGGAASVLIGAMAGAALLDGRMARARRIIGLVLVAIGAWLMVRVLT